MIDRLAFIRQVPGLVERIVRVAAREAIDAKRVHDRTLAVRDIANVALAELDRTFPAAHARLDGVGRYELAEATVRAATAFAQSRLARRLMRVPVARFRPAPAGADVALVDRTGAPHVVRIEAFASDAERVACTRTIAAACAREASVLRAPAVHFFSLRDGKLRSFAAPPASILAPTPLATRAA